MSQKYLVTIRRANVVDEKVQLGRAGIELLIEADDAGKFFIPEKLFDEVIEAIKTEEQKAYGEPELEYKKDLH